MIIASIIKFILSRYLYSFCPLYFSDYPPCFLVILLSPGWGMPHKTPGWSIPSQGRCYAVYLFLSLIRAGRAGQKGLSVARGGRRISDMTTPCQSMAGLLKKSICSSVISSPEISGAAGEGIFNSPFICSITGWIVRITSRGAVSISGHFIGLFIVGTSTFLGGVGGVGGGASDIFRGETSGAAAPSP